jgi:hypothetical protein
MRIQDKHDIKGAADIISKQSCLEEIEKSILAIQRNEPSSWVNSKKEFLNSLASFGWTTDCVLDRNLKITVSAVKERTGLAFQTGNIARAGYDILKLGGLYGAGDIDAAVIVTPMQEINGKNNTTFFERVSREAQFLTRAHPMPLLIVGINN